MSVFQKHQPCNLKDNDEKLFPSNNNDLEIGIEICLKDGFQKGYEEGYKYGIKESEKKIQNIYYISNHINNILRPFLEENIKESKFEFKNFNTFFSITENFQYTIIVNYNNNDLLEYNLEHCTNSDTSSPITIIFITMDDLIEELLNLYEVYSSNLYEDTRI